MFKSNKSIVNNQNKSINDNFQRRSMSNNFQDFQKVYGHFFNQQQKKVPPVTRNPPSRKGFRSNTEIKMIKIDMPQMGSEHAILQTFSSGNKFTNKTELNIKLLMEGAKDISKRLKDIQKMLQEKRNQLYADHQNRINRNNFQEAVNKNRYCTVSTRQNLVKKQSTDSEIKTLFENTLLRQKESLQEIPEEDSDKQRAEDTIVKK